jgi:hypothetical protein
VPIAGACGLTGWRAAMMLVGGPGILVSLLVWTLREPPRPLPQKQNIGAIVLREFSASVPPLTFWAIGREGGSKALRVNIAVATTIILTAIGLGLWTHDWPQWIGLGLGVYALLSWGSMLRIRDLPLYKLTYGCPTFMTTLGGYTFLSCIMLSIQFWSVPYAIRVLEIPPAKAGLYMGVAIAGTAVLGNLIGGVLLDWWRKRDVRAPLWIGLISMIVKAPFVFVMFTTKDPDLFMILFLLQAILGSMYPPGAAVVAQELVLVRMRGTAAACFSLTILLVSLACGPYMLGKISTLTGSLSLGILSAYAFAPPALILFLLAARRLPKENEASRLARARQYGEPV